MKCWNWKMLKALKKESQVLPAAVRHQASTASEREPWPPDLPSLSMYLDHSLESFERKQESDLDDFLNTRCTGKMINLNLKWDHAPNQNNDTSWLNAGGDSVAVCQQIKLLLSRCYKLGIYYYSFMKSSLEHDHLKAVLTIPHFPLKELLQLKWKKLYEVRMVGSI